MLNILSLIIPWDIDRLVGVTEIAKTKQFNSDMDFREFNKNVLWGVGHPIETKQKQREHANSTQEGPSQT